MSGKSNNVDRAERAAGCLEEYSLKTERECAVTDLLTDLRHLCRFNRYDFAKALESSLMHFEAELEEER
jgi:hypothetical protein